MDGGRRDGRFGGDVFGAGRFDAFDDVRQHRVAVAAIGVGNFGNDQE